METFSVLLALCKGNAPVIGSPHKDQWRELWCTWTNGWANNRDAVDLRRYRAHYDVTVIRMLFWCRISELLSNEGINTKITPGWSYKLFVTIAHIISFLTQHNGLIKSDMKKPLHTSTESLTRSVYVLLMTIVYTRHDVTSQLWRKVVKSQWFTTRWISISFTPILTTDRIISYVTTDMPLP